MNSNQSQADFEPELPQKNSQQQESTEKKPKPAVKADPPIWPWILPFVAYMVLLLFDPSLDANPYANRHPKGPSIHLVDSNAEQPESTDNSEWLPAFAVYKYVGVTFLRFLVVGGLIVIGFRYYRKQFPLKIGFWWLPVGVIGVVSWIGLCQLSLESKILVGLGFESNALGERAAFNPFDSIQSIGLLASFLVVRFAILSIIVPLAEEIFLRGFLMRFVQQVDWWRADFGKLKWWVLGVAPVYGVLTHPSEFFAAAVWFSLVTWLMVHTRNLWECVMAHATTNLLLGIYVVMFSQWQLW